MPVNLAKNCEGLREEVENILDLPVTKRLEKFLVDLFWNGYH